MRYKPLALPLPPNPRSLIWPVPLHLLTGLPVSSLAAFKSILQPLVSDLMQMWPWATLSYSYAPPVPGVSHTDLQMLHPPS